MLVKLTAGVNFISVLGAAFAGADPKSKKDSQVVNLFRAFGICAGKSSSARRAMMKLNPDRS